MEKFLALPLFWGAAIVLGFLVVWILSRLTNGKVKVDLYAAINCFLFFALIFNIYSALTKETLYFITVFVIAGILYFRIKTNERWI